MVQQEIKMAKIKIVADSACDIGFDTAKKYNIELIPMNIFFGDEKYKEGINIDSQECYDRIANAKSIWPTTSQPSPREFYNAYTKIFDDGYETILSIHVSSQLSGTLNSVNAAKNMFPGKDIIAIDSKTATHAFGLMVIEAAKLAKKGKTKEEILTRLKNSYIPNARVCGVVETLEYLHRGGRIGRAKKILGNLFNKKPLIQVKDGLVDSFGTSKGFEEGFNNFVKMAPIIFDNLNTDRVILGYASDDQHTQEFYEILKDLPNRPKNLEVKMIGPAIGVHLGPGALTIAWIGNWDELWYGSNLEYLSSTSTLASSTSGQTSSHQ
ncbi:MAG: DegV family protein [Asgard group archaeon]|nr:DegV family protein [Asgard group archaeon]